MGCCDAGNDQQQSKSFTELDGVFSSLGGGCDICAINLKRFWCEYACSPNQAEFTDVEDGYFPIPDPQKPGEFITAQKITIRVQAQTACDLFNACNRNEFVSAVSAMSTPAGFLTFQGHNAVNDALQYMEIKFSYNKSNSIYFGNDNPDETGKALHNCNTTTSEKKIHGFPCTFYLIQSKRTVLAIIAAPVASLMRGSYTPSPQYSKISITYQLVELGQFRS